jgi:hypothetical protein
MDNIAEPLYTTILINLLTLQVNTYGRIQIVSNEYNIS